MADADRVNGVVPPPLKCHECQEEVSDVKARICETCIDNTFKDWRKLPNAMEIVTSYTFCADCLVDNHPQHKGILYKEIKNRGSAKECRAYSKATLDSPFGDVRRIFSERENSIMESLKRALYNATLHIEIAKTCGEAEDIDNELRALIGDSQREIDVHTAKHLEFLNNIKSRVEDLNTRYPLVQRPARVDIPRSSAPEQNAPNYRNIGQPIRNSAERALDELNFNLPPPSYSTLSPARNGSPLAAKVPHFEMQSSKENITGDSDSLVLVNTGSVPINFYFGFYKKKLDYFINPKDGVLGVAEQKEVSFTKGRDMQNTVDQISLYYYPEGNDTSKKSIKIHFN